MCDMKTIVFGGLWLALPFRDTSITSPAKIGPN